MIELRTDELVFSFPEVHPDARLSIGFQRTLRIPDDGRDYPLPAGLGNFPLRHVDDFPSRVPPSWIDRGGVMLPMYQSEAMWLNFSTMYVGKRGVKYPFAIKIAAGKINAVSGAGWSDGLHRNPQDYVVVPDQPWLDGFCVEKSFIRQFVAMPLGSGYSVEEQVTGEATHGGLQIVVYPMKPEAFARYRAREEAAPQMDYLCECATVPSMGLAAGGRMRQEIYDDPFNFSDWDLSAKGRCFIHIANSMTWRSITGEQPPTVPPTAREYREAGIPWFDYYSENSTAVKGSDILKKVKSVAELAKEKGDKPLPENETITPENIVKLYRKGLQKDEVREGRF